MNKRLSILTLLSACLSLQAQQTWTLRQCIEHAIDHNIAIQQGANQVEQTKVAVNTAKWARLPNLNGNAGQSWNWGRTQTFLYSPDWRFLISMPWLN